MRHNVVPRFQLTTGAAERRKGPKRTYRWVFESLRTLRFELLNIPAKLATPEGRPQLRLASAPEVQRRIPHTLDTMHQPA